MYSKTPARLRNGTSDRTLAFEILLKLNLDKGETCVAKQVFLMRGQTGIWVTCANPRDGGKLTTIAFCADGEMTGCKMVRNEQQKFRRIPQENGQTSDIFFTKIVNTKFIAYAVCSEQNLWVWGSPPQDEELFDFEVAEDYCANRIKWFRERNLKVVDIQVGHQTLLVKALDSQSGIIEFYGMPFYVEEMIDDLEGMDGDEVSWVD